jgi:hypothetical protein
MRSSGTTDEAGERTRAPGRRQGHAAHPSKFIACTAALVLFLALVLVGNSSALADGSGQDAGLPTSQALIQAVESGESSSIQMPMTDPAAAESLPHSDLDRSEAVALLQSVFDDQLHAPAGIFDHLDVDRFVAPNVAVIGGEGSASPAPEVQPVVPPQSDGDALPVIMEGRGQLNGEHLLDSSIPLRTESPSEGPEAVDLSLQRTEGKLRPADALVEVAIPQMLGEGIELPGPGLTIELAGAPEERAASVVDQSVGFLPNVAADTDLAVAPTPTGVETLTQLRSSDAPHTQTFNLGLPAGATLQATDNGGAVVKEGEKTLVAVMSPTAIDATGSSVPVSLAVNGSSIRITASPDQSARFPILVDPLFQSYVWANSAPWQSGICNSSFTTEVSSNCNTHEEWSYEHHEKSVPPHIRLENRAYGFSRPVPQGTPGIFIETKQEPANELYLVHDSVERRLECA